MGVASHYYPVRGSLPSSVELALGVDPDRVGWMKANPPEKGLITLYSPLL